MKVVQSHLFRAFASVIIGVLLIQYREQTVTWITIAIGVLFLLSGVVSVTTYLSARKQVDAPQLFDANGNQIMGRKPTFPIVGIGSILFGSVLALMPNTFISGLMFILSAVLILGAIGQFINLATANRYSHIGLFYWLMPAIILLIGLIALIRPSTIASAPLLIIGWCMLFYGVVECINIIKINLCRKDFEKNMQHNKSSDVNEEDAVEIKDETDKK